MVTVVLDASAMIAFLRDEPGASVVATTLLDPRNSCHAHPLNLCEVYYDFYRAEGSLNAENVMAAVSRMGVVQDSQLSSSTWRAAGALRASLRRLSLADCFAIELATRLNGMLLTADHHEFDPVLDRLPVSVRFIR